MDYLSDSSLTDSARSEKYMDFYDKLGRGLAGGGLLFLLGLISQVLTSKLILISHKGKTCSNTLCLILFLVIWGAQKKRAKSVSKEIDQKNIEQASKVSEIYDALEKIANVNVSHNLV